MRGRPITWMKEAHCSCRSIRGTINHYKTNLLADDEDNQKHLCKSEEAKHDYEEFKKGMPSRLGATVIDHITQQAITMIPCNGMALEVPVEQKTQWYHPDY